LKAQTLCRKKTLESENISVLQNIYLKMLHARINIALKKMYFEQYIASGKVGVV
jgi:hypothetical protein